MAEIIKQHKDLAFIVGIGLTLAIAGILVLLGMVPLSVLADETSTVEVTATVEPWLTFSVSPTSTALSPSLVDSGGTANIASSTDNISLILGTNSGIGWSVSIIGDNAGLATSTYDLIDSVALAGTTTVAIDGNDYYGANATNSIADAVAGTYYDNWGTEIVGAIASSTSQTLINKNSANASTTVGLMKVYAACNTDQESGTYADTITLTAAASYP